MKKYIILIITAFIALTSCKVSGTYNVGIQPYELYKLSKKTMVSYVAIPVETVELILEFDKYLQLSQEDKEKDLRFYGVVNQIYDDVFELNDGEEYKISCIVKTNGVSLQDYEAEWIVRSLEVSGYDFTLEESVSVRYSEDFVIINTADSEWSMFGDYFTTKMTYEGEDSGRDMWKVHTQGTEKADNGLVTKFITPNELTVKELVRREDSTYRGNAYGGAFNVEVCKRERRLDYCYITFIPGFTTKYETSRDQ